MSCESRRGPFKSHLCHEFLRWPRPGQVLSSSASWLQSSDDDPPLPHRVVVFRWQQDNTREVLWKRKTPYQCYVVVVITNKNSGIASLGVTAIYSQLQRQTFSLLLAPFSEGIMVLGNFGHVLAILFPRWFHSFSSNGTTQRSSRTRFLHVFSGSSSGQRAFSRLYL